MFSRQAQHCGTSRRQLTAFADGTIGAIRLVFTDESVDDIPSRAKATFRVWRSHLS